jgi:hypothetical protein
VHAMTHKQCIPLRNQFNKTEELISTQDTEEASVWIFASSNYELDRMKNMDFDCNAVSSHNFESRLCLHKTK